MITFKEYIAEEEEDEVDKPAGTESLSTMLFDLHSKDIKTLKIPIHSAILKRVIPSTVRATVFHVTEYAGMEKIIKMQGGKRSISAFTHNENTVGDGQGTGGVFRGIAGDGGYVMELEADILLASPADLFSTPDRSGRRWVYWDSLITQMGGATKLRGMEKDLEKMLKGIIKEYNEEDSITTLVKTDVAAAWMEFGKGDLTQGGNLVGKRSGRWTRLIIKDYFDGMERVMKKYSTKLKDVFYGYLTGAALNPKRSKNISPSATWDELLVNNFKVIKVHVPEQESGEDWTGGVKADGTVVTAIPGLPDDKIKIWTKNSGLETHIKTVSAAEFTKRKV